MIAPSQKALGYEAYNQLRTSCAFHHKAKASIDHVSINAMITELKGITEVNHSSETAYEIH